MLHWGWCFFQKPPHTMPKPPWRMRMRQYRCCGEKSSRWRWTNGGFPRKANRDKIRSKNCIILGWKSAFSCRSNKKSKAVSLAFRGLKRTSVLVTHWERVKLMEGFLGSCWPCFPQYFTKAMLLGACQAVWNSPSKFFEKTNESSIIKTKILHALGGKKYWWSKLRSFVYEENMFFTIAVAVVLCLGVGFLTGQATELSVKTWYTTLEKPFFTPPTGFLLLFGPYFM